MKVAIILLLIMSLLFIGCANNKVIDGINYQPYGLINQDDIKSPKVNYSPCWGNIIWGCVLAETIIVPVCLFGFFLFEPESAK
jgi:hypothetical protein